MERRRPGEHSGRHSPGRSGPRDGQDRHGGARRPQHQPTAPMMPLAPPGKVELYPPPPKPKRKVEIAAPGTSSVELEQQEREAEQAARKARRQAEPVPAMTPRRSKKPAHEPRCAPTDVCKVVYADDAVVVVDKAPGFPVTPVGAFDKRSVVKSLQAQGYFPVYPINLLDAEASGLVVLSRSEAAAHALRWNWRSSLCERTYIGVVQGDIVGGRGRISLAIGAVRQGHGVRHQVQAIEEGGRRAVTAWKLLARGRGMSRLQLTLKSGRCHQIRIHLAGIGFPLVGDKRYGGRTTTEVPLEALIELPSKHSDAPTLPPGQIALHCARIQMPHPISGQPMNWTAPVPRTLTALMPGAWVVEG